MPRFVPEKILNHHFFRRDQMDDLLRKLRQKHNNDVLRRFKSGDSLLGRPESTWFPPRPAIKKDKNLIASVYCSSGHTWENSKCVVCGLQEKDTPNLRVID
jgi:hypothetical protein